MVERSSPGPQATPSKTQRVVGEVPALRLRKGQQGPWPREGRLAPSSHDTQGTLPFRMGRGEGRQSARTERRKGSPRVSPCPLPAAPEKLGGRAGVEPDPLGPGVLFLAGE